MFQYTGLKFMIFIYIFFLIFVFCYMFSSVFTTSIVIHLQGLNMITMKEKLIELLEILMYCFRSLPYKGWKFILCQRTFGSFRIL